MKTKQSSSVMEPGAITVILQRNRKKPKIGLNMFSTFQRTKTKKLCYQYEEELLIKAKAKQGGITVLEYLRTLGVTGKLSCR